MINKKQECDLISDLLPLYLENKTSRETGDFIREHLAECPECRKNLEFMNSSYEEMLEDEQAIILAEWPDPIARMLPADRLEMNFILEHGDLRTIELASYGRVSDALLEGLCNAVAH